MCWFIECDGEQCFHVCVFVGCDIEGMLSFLGMAEWFVAGWGDEFGVWLVVCFYESIAFVSNSWHGM